MDGDQMKRIEEFLQAHGLDTGSVPQQRIRQLQRIDDAIQKRLASISEAQRLLKENSISIASIAEESGITRKTFYNNEILKQYVESFTAVNGEPGKLVKASELDAMRKRLDEQADDIAKMIARDIDVETVRHEVDELQKVISIKDQQIRNLTEMYEATLAELQEERRKNHSERVIPFEHKNV